MRSIHLAALFCFASIASFASAEQPTAAEVEYFEKQVRPVLVEKCVSCHGAKVQRGGLRVDSREALLRGGDSGPALLPGRPEASLLIKVVRRGGELKMPPKDKDRLEDQAVAGLSTWVARGAAWPKANPSAPTLSAVALARKTHWAFRPIVAPPVPALRNTEWAITPLDRFVQAHLEEKGLAPSPPASRTTLIRRVTFDLTGLPPTPEEIEDFLADPRPNAYEHLVDRLLASPAYGERWGRHWLDVARYADTKGYVFQEERRYPFSYTYRDWVIDALNRDLPYDRFVQEQLAGDRLTTAEDRRPLAAMGFLTLGRRFLNNVHDIIDDRIDVVGRGLMGLTVGCARCHDHKYDPVPSRDYYSLYGVFASSIEPPELPLLEKRDTKGMPTTFESDLRKRQSELDELTRKLHQETNQKYRKLAADYLLAASGGKNDDLQPAMLARWRNYLAQAGKGHHAVLGAWFAFARIPAGEFGKQAPALAARIAANKEPAKRLEPRVARMFEGSPPGSLAEVAQRYRKLFAEAESSSSKDPGTKAILEILFAADAPPNVPVADLRRFIDRAQRNRLMAAKRRVDQFQATANGGPPRAMALVDAPRMVEPQVFLRGNPNNRGVSVPRQFLEVLAPERKPFTEGSGRLDLARAITAPDNPLTSRVMVNRVWMHHFGKGIVRTPGDFGLRGEPPTHPELLDYLAAQFLRDPSLKRLHRVIVLSAVYRQSSEENPRGLAVDPENNLWWRMSRRRLELEPLRDAMLLAVGRLDRKMGGPGVELTRQPYPHQRSVYAFIERQNLPGMFRTFDLASPDVSTPQRHATTVPQQSLYLMNSPFVQELARAFLARPEIASAASDEVRIDRMHRLAYGRPADSEERVLGLAFVRQSPSGKGPEMSPWEQYAQVLLLANEFAFVD